MLRLLGTGLVALVLVGCATRPDLPPATTLLHDDAFEAVAQRVDASDPFAMSEPMRRYAEVELRALASRRDPRRALIDALYGDRQLRLSYDAGWTRNAAQAFDARSGNCLSLVIMTAAFARHLGMEVRFQSVLVDETYSRHGNLFMAAGHVNLVLDRTAHRGLRDSWEETGLVVDFMPPDELRGQRTRPLREHTVHAMYLNNRAAETLAEGRLPEAYGWARQALLRDPELVMAVNTLAVIYSRAGHGALAEAALRHVLAAEPDSTSALANLAGLLRREGRGAEADAVAARLVQLQPVPPFHYFELGRQAMEAGDPRRAFDHFRRELRRQPLQDEVHFWAAQAAWQIGRPEDAAGHLRQAMENSTTRDTRQRYAAKLASLRAMLVR